MKRVVIFTITFLICMVSYGQADDSEITGHVISPGDITESIAETIDDDIEFDEIFAQMEDLNENSININEADERALHQIYFLDDYRISSLLDHIEAYGEIMTLYELNAVEGFDSDLINAILPYIKISPITSNNKFRLKNLFLYGKSQLLLRTHRIIEPQQGYSLKRDSILSLNSNQYYLGSPASLYLRYSYTCNNNIKLGFTFDKDPGEEFFRGSEQSGFDFYSAFLQLKNIGKIQNLIIGDYKINFGQGLALSSGLAFGKSSDAIKIKRYRFNITPYSSANESSVLRGAATSISINQFSEATLFFSSKKWDGNIMERDTSYNSGTVFSSLSESGYHRTLSEIKNKHSISETLFGGSISMKLKKVKTDLLYYKSTFNVPRQHSSDIYKFFYKNGRSNQIVSISYNYLLKRYSLFGEVSHNLGGGYSILNGITAYLSPLVSIILLHRYYQKNYNCLYCNALSESGRVYNENGLYFGLSFQICAQLKLSAYFDNFIFPWLRYRVDSPSGGIEQLCKLEYTPSRNTLMYFRFRYKSKKQNNSGETLNRVINQKYFNIRYHLEYNISRTISMKNRIEILYHKNDDDDYQQSSLLYQDIIFSPVNSGIKISLRYAIFDTDAYSSRIYAYENDVLYSYSTPAYYDKGYRYYLLITAPIFKDLSLWIRFARTKFSNRETIGSGATLINGNAKSEIKMMLRWKF